MDFDANLFDEFGNYIGPALDSDEEEEDLEQEQQSRTAAYASTSARLPGYDDEDDEDFDASRAGGMAVDDDDEEMGGPSSNAIILHDNKKYYPLASEVYGEDVETMVQEEDLQPLSEPIVAPVKVRKFRVEEKDAPQTTFDKK